MRIQSKSRNYVFFAACAALACVTSPAFAADEQPSLALDRFNPSYAGDRFFGVTSPFAAGDPGLHLMLLGDYAHEPLVLRRDADDEQVGAVVSDQLVLHLNGSVAFKNRFVFNVDVPMALAQSGEAPSDGSSTFSSPSGADFGDVRLGGRVNFIGSYFDALQVSGGLFLWLPTGSGAFVSDDAVRAKPELTIGGRAAERWIWSVALGPELRASSVYGSVQQGSMISGGAGVAYLFGEKRNLQVGPELLLATVAEDPESRNTNAELILGGKYRFLPAWEAGLGIGPGLTSGIGTPTLRGVAMVAYTQEPIQDGDRDKDGIKDSKDACPDTPGVADKDPKKHGCPVMDRDKDGILDDVDACPDVPGVANEDASKHGCPLPLDRDKDGIIDDVDACPDVPGVANDDPKKHGCPSDKDGDGIYDTDDACVDIPGVATQDPATNGCPPDTDGDGIRDDKDACPQEKGKPNEDPKKNGCPESVRVTDKEIFILQQVQFDTAKASIRKESDALLDEVAGVFKDHPEITLVEIQGHTDSRGSKYVNTKLSQDRADAVKKALVARGIDEKRFTTKGYGPDKPVAPNDTAENMQKNRRVQFVILKKEDKKAQP